MTALNVSRRALSTTSLLLIGGGVFQRDSFGGLTGKTAVVSYVHGLSKWFDKTIWATNLNSGPKLFSTRLHFDLITASILNGQRTRIWADFCTLSTFVTPKTIIFLHLPNPWLALPVLAICHKAKAFFVYIANDYVQHSQVMRSQRGPLYSYLFRKSHEMPICWANGVIARGAALRKKARHLNPNVIETVPIAALLPTPLARDASPCIRPQLRVLYVGKLIREKGIDVLLRACAHLRISLPNRPIELTIVGAGPELEMLKQLGNNLQFGSAINYLGYIDDASALGTLYAQADVVVIPSSHPEGVPRVIDEAISHGTPVIASAVGGIPDEFKNGEVALVPPADEKALSSTMQHLVCSENFRRNLLIAANKRAQSLATQPSAADQHAKFIMQTLGVQK